MIQKKSHGFTLVELLVVIGITVAMGTVLIGVFFTTLRGTNKSNVETLVRQNGNYAISQMARMIRNARSFDGISTTENDVNYIYSCPVTPPPPIPTPIPEKYKYLRITSFDNIQTTFSCGTDTNPEIASNGASLIDTSAISVVSCHFYCSQPSLSYPPKIEIDFKLSQKSQSDLSESQAKVNFNTSVFVRNQ